jgi:Fic family protein
MPERSLGFKFAERVPWLEKGRTIATTLADITGNFKSEWKFNPGSRLDLSTAVNYVHQSNVGESVGTQTLGDTHVIVERTASGETQLSKTNKEERVSVNTYHALRHIEELIQDMNRSGLLTVQVVCDIHARVLEGLHPTAGKIRECDVYTTVEDGRLHVYPPPSTLEDRFYYIIDKHNIHMTALSMDRFQNPQERVEYVFKCAAWLLFHLVSLHPFADGNGRTCRLLASYVLSSFITPFPVSVYHQNSQSCRADYIHAIVHCRENPEEGPEELASLLLEGAYLGWKSDIY